MMYSLAALGGTFDRFHSGHEHLIDTALNTASRLLIGITMPELVTHKTLSQLIEPYPVRVNNVKTALIARQALDRVELVPLNDPYGPTISNPHIDVLVLSPQTREGGVLINDKRQQAGLPALPVVETEMILNQQGDHISSTQIREGVITRSGTMFNQLFTKDIKFSEENLQRLKQEQGVLLQPDDITTTLLKKCTKVWLVGDEVTRLFLDRQLPFSGAIIDGKTGRNQTVLVPPQAIHLHQVNPPGTISAQVVSEIMKLRNNVPSPFIIKVDGEEDLLGFVPCMTEPLETGVFYGQPDKGIVMIRLTEAEKLRIAHGIQSDFI